VIQLAVLAATAVIAFDDFRVAAAPTPQ